jgi:hypothetical protein
MSDGSDNSEDGICVSIYVAAEYVPPDEKKTRRPMVWIQDEFSHDVRHPSGIGN